jgi:hypothetical protein
MLIIQDLANDYQSINTHSQSAARSMSRQGAISSCRHGEPLTILSKNIVISEKCNAAASLDAR